MPVEWLAGFTHRYVTNRLPPKRRQLGLAHRATPTKIVLHTIEGASSSGAFATYDQRAGAFTGGVHPHITADPYRRERFQHVPLTRASYSLKRGDTDGVIQIELVGWADRGYTLEQYDWIGAEVIAPILEACPKIPAIAPAPFLGASAGLLAAPWPRGKARLSPSQWSAAAGILGHQHAPSDDHWDPGAINIDRILAAATTTLATPISGTTDQEEDLLLHIRHDTTMGWYWSIDPTAPANKVKEIKDPSGLKLEGVPIQRSASMRHLMKHHWGITSFAGKSF